MSTSALHTADAVWSEHRQATMQRPRFPLTRIRDVQPVLHGRYLVKGLLQRASLTVIWGPPKCGKSFWTLDLVGHVAVGAPYRQQKVRQGTVLYIAAEGAEGFNARAKAWCTQHLVEEDDPAFHIMAKRIDLVHDHRAFIAEIDAKLGGAHPAVVVIDTLNRTYAGSESSDADMTAYVAAADAIKEAFSAAVIIVHHCGHEKSRPRGHTALAGAADAQISIRKDQTGLVTATVDFAKDMADGYSNASRLRKVSVGEDEDGEAVTTCIIEPSEEKPVDAVARLSPPNAIAMKALDFALASEGQTRTLAGMPTNVKSVPTDLWRGTFYRMSLEEAPEGNQAARQKAFKRAAVQLQAKELVGCASNHVWKVRERPDGRTMP